ncbi:PEGA domain-containing protein [Streptomyces sp. NPDC001698]|uniref:PEGA domain-containing protein n=1 Tax=unclassified Streptomyces TaxID=2593676 RepID=UPI0036C5C5B0
MADLTRGSRAATGRFRRDIILAGSCHVARTGKDGTYALWFDSRLNPVTVIVSKDGYQPVTTTVKLKKGETTTGDFTLKKPL